MIPKLIPQSCLLIETDKFPVLDGEEDEIGNDGMYGKALCEYLEAELPRVGINVPSFCSEDWGWWLEVEHNGFKMELLIFCDLDVDWNPKRYALLPSIGVAKKKKWPWSRSQSVDMSQDVLALVGLVETVFKNDSQIRAVTRHDACPFL